MVKGMPSFDYMCDTICRGCALGKNVKKKFPRNHTRYKGILYLVHSYVCGPISSPSLSGHLYYVLFIDDFSRKAWIYFMKAKSETFYKFQEFKALVEDQTSRHIRALRSDNGGYFESNAFNEFCSDVGICRQLTVPYNPQQNGVAERKNRILCEAAKSMLHDRDISAYLWAEATSTAVYIQNRSPHAVLDEKTPKEVFTGEKPDISHLRIFGCPVYIHIQKEKRINMEHSRNNGTFVGYSETSKEVIIYVPGERHVEVSWDVAFHV